MIYVAPSKRLVTRQSHNSFACLHGVSPQHHRIQSHTCVCAHTHKQRETLFQPRGIYKQLQGWDQVQIFIHVLTGSGHTRYLGTNLGEKKSGSFFFFYLANMIYEKGNLICYCISKVLFTMYN